MNNIQRGRELFTLDQRKLFMKIPEDECSIGAYYTLSTRGKATIRTQNSHMTILNSKY